MPKQVRRITVLIIYALLFLVGVAFVIKQSEPLLRAPVPTRASDALAQAPNQSPAVAVRDTDMPSTAQPTTPQPSSQPTDTPARLQLTLQPDDNDTPSSSITGDQNQSSNNDPANSKSTNEPTATNDRDTTPPDDNPVGQQSQQEQNERNPLTPPAATPVSQGTPRVAISETPTQARVLINTTPQTTATPPPTATETALPPLPSPTTAPTIAATPTTETIVSAYYVDNQFTGKSTGSSEAPFTSIQAAVDAAASDRPMTIFVQSGVYVEQVNLQRKPLTVRSATNNATDVVIGGIGGQTLLTMGGANQTLYGITLRGLRGYNTGVTINDAGSVTILSSRLDNLERGVHVTGAATVSTAHNLLTYTHHALQVDNGAASLDAFNNLILHSARGIYAQAPATIRNNTIARTHRALDITAPQATIQHNIVWDNRQDAKLAVAELTLNANIFQHGSYNQPDADPQFATGTHGDYYLTASSPAVDAGTQPADALSLDGRSALINSSDSGSVDLGFHYGSEQTFFHEAKQIYVDSTHEGFQEGSTDLPWQTIDAALAQTRLGRSGDVLLLAAGTYTETITIDRRDVVLRGNATRDTVILDANNTGRALTLHNSETVIDGITIQNGSASQGAGIAITTDDNLTVRKAIVRDVHLTANTATKSGGALYAENASPLIERSLFTDNTAPRGSALMLSGSGDMTMQNNLLHDNHDGSVVTIAASNATVQHNTLTANAAGLHALSSAQSDTTVQYNVLWNNNGFDWQDDTTTLAISDNLVSNAATTASNANAQTVSTAQSPFMDAASGDYHLRPDSSGVDAAPRNDDLTLDYAGNDRPQDGNDDGTALPDYGAFETKGTLVLPPAPENALHVNPNAATNGDGSRSAPFSSVRAALDAASSGATIELMPATYTQPITVDKPVTLQAATTRNGAVVLETPGQTALTITADNVTVDGITIRNSTRAIVIDTVTNVTVVNMLLTGNTRALHADNSNGLIANNLIRNNSGDIAGILASGDMTIAFNTLVNNRTTDNCTTCVGGIYVESETVTVEANVLWQNDDDIGYATAPQTVRYNLISDGDFADTNHNITSQPLFSDATRLTPGSGSPLVDTLPQSFATDYIQRIQNDRYGTARPTDGNSDGIASLDIGAVEAGIRTNLQSIQPTAQGTQSDQPRRIDPLPPQASPTPMPTTMPASATPTPTHTAVPATATSTATATMQPSATPTNTATPPPTNTPPPTATPSPTPVP